jgi:hypothetical protein
MHKARCGASRRFSAGHDLVTQKFGMEESEMTFDEHSKDAEETSPTTRAGGNVITKGPSQAEPQADQRAGGNVITKGGSHVEPGEKASQS